MVPRFILNLIEDDIAIMANWIEKIGYGANLDLLNQLTKELNIKNLKYGQNLRSSDHLKIFEHHDSINK